MKNNFLLSAARVPVSCRHSASDFRVGLRTEYGEEHQQCQISVQLTETNVKKHHLSVRGQTVNSLTSQLLLSLFFDDLF